MDEVLHLRVLQIYQNVGNNFLFQQHNASISAIWQGTVCNPIMSYPLDNSRIGTLVRLTMTKLSTRGKYAQKPHRMHS